MILLNIDVFLGRFHPLMVHLPIGFLLLAGVLQFLGTFPKYKNVRAAVPLTLFAGCLSAIIACITGYLLSLSGDYDLETLDLHMWMGIITAVIAFLAWLFSIKIIRVKWLQSGKLLNLLMLLMMFFISIAGHYGGSLTHGSDYLSTDMLFKKEKEKKQITNVNEALVFEDIVHPILIDKCGACHNADKKKGQLSIESLALIKKGGKNGAVIKEGNALESELIKRVLLDPKDEKFMPTDGKTPLTKEETAIIKWWIETQAAKPDMKLAAAKPPAEILTGIQKLVAPASSEDQAKSNIGEHPVAALKTPAPKLNSTTLNTIKNAGFVIKQISFNPDLLDITLPSKEGVSGNDKIQLLNSIKNNIYWLNISDNQITDDQLSVIKTFANLQRLRLDENPITDKGIQQLKTLQALESINLCSTKITAASVPVLKEIKSLKTVYVWGTSVDAQIPQDSTALRVVSAFAKSGDKTTVVSKP